MSKTAKLIIDKNIGEYDTYAELFGESQPCFSSKDMRTFIDANADADTFEVEIRSNGGSVSEGFAIYDMLTTSGKTIKTIGYKVNSIAVVIFLAGSERLISANATPVPHNPYIDPWSLGFDGLTADDLLEISEDVRKAEDQIFNLYVKVLGLDDAKQASLKELMKADTSCTANEFLDYGFATSIIKGGPAAMKITKTAAYSTKIAALLKDKQKSNNNIMDKKTFLAGLADFKKEIMDLLGRKVKNASEALEDGTTMYFDGTLAEGTMVFSDEAMTTALADGEYKTTSGNTVTVASGAVTTIVEAVVEDPATIAELQETVTAKDVEIAALKKQINDSVVAKKKTDAAILALSKKAEDLAKYVPGDDKGGNTPREKRKYEDLSNKEKALYNRGELDEVLAKS